MSSEQIVRKPLRAHERSNRTLDERMITLQRQGRMVTLAPAKKKALGSAGKVFSSSGGKIVVVHQRYDDAESKDINDNGDGEPAEHGMHAPMFRAARCLLWFCRYFGISVH